MCGYHGFTYYTTGTVYVPGQKRVPRTARVASYPVAERDSLVWVWIGDPALADPEAVPRARHLDAAGWVTVRGMEPIDADYGPLVDTLLDLSHETYLHGGYIGTPRSPRRRSPPRSTRAPGIVRVGRHMDDAQRPPFYARSTGISRRIDRWQDIEYHAPCLYVLHNRVAPAGTLPAPDGGDPDGFHTEITYAITPSGDGKVYDFWAVSRDWATDDAEVTEFLYKNNPDGRHAGRRRAQPAPAHARQ
ncbi:Aromatic ring-hydroxylating dioxygenase subunit alpha OS=Streptomyces tendae OX=1932 GN=GUR47_02245 PE=4 SV=1 [Streptomyces tendae]